MKFEVTPAPESHPHGGSPSTACCPQQRLLSGSTLTMTVGAMMIAVIAMFVGGAIGIGQERPDEPSSRIHPAPVAAQQLSANYRSVAKATLPGIVSIETLGPAGQAAQGIDMDELFGGDPRFEEFFNRVPELRRQFRNREQSPRPMRRGQGSGFLIDDQGHIVTNSHVVSGAQEVKVRLHDGREYIAEVIGTDPRSDVAVIKIDADNYEPVPIGNSDEVEVGDFVLAFGSPFGLEMTMTQGIISAKGRGPGINEREDYLQTDAAINPGNSGGPLVNLNGEVIGINTAISSRSGGYDGVAFAIPSNMARWSIEQLIKTGSVKRAYLGVQIQPLSTDLATELGIGVRQGAVIRDVMPDSPAEKAGLKSGDVIRELNGQLVSGTRELQGIVEKLDIDKSYPVLILRDGQEQKLKVPMAEMPDQFSMTSRQIAPRQPTRESEPDQQ